MKIIVLCLSLLIWGKVSAQINGEEQTVRQVLQNYLDGRNNGDIKLLSSAFNDSADLRYVNNGKLTIWPVASYIKSFTPGKRMDCKSSIVSIDIMSTAAQAMIEIEYPTRKFTDYINLLKIEGKWQIANKIYASRQLDTSRRILFVMTSHEEMGTSGRKTGLHLGEVAGAWKVLAENGFEIDFASPAGGKTSMYGADVNDSAVIGFLQDRPAFHRFSNAMKLSEVQPKKYTAIFFAGGHGAMWDFSTDNLLPAIIADIYERNGIVSAVCHGSAALVNVQLENGSPLVKGKKITAFTDAEEKESGNDKVVPFLLENRLRKEGGNFIAAAPWQRNVVKDSRLITGQNPASASAVAEEIVKTIGTH